jgi:transcriptional regulator with XRE-family HTH domain
VTWTVEVGSDLRRLFWRARKDKERWPPKGLTQEQVAVKIGRSQVWYRSIENGYQPTASLDTITDICELFTIEPLTLDALGYHDVAEELRARAGVPRREEEPGVIEVDPKELGRLSKEEQQAFLLLLRKLRGREEPFGRDVWRR